MSKRPVILLILDGWGIGRMDESNPIYIAKPANINRIKSDFPAGSLQASGISVGLPWNEEGNSEVGHLNMGAGKIVYQYYPKITLAIRDKSFFQNQALKNAFRHAKKNNSAVNLVGLLSAGNVHSSLEHIEALINFAAEEKIEKLNLHLFTDGRDSQPKSVFSLLSRFPRERLASLSGRFYSMDKDNHWDRTQRTYDVLVGRGPVADNLESPIKKAIEENLNEEYVEPALIGPEKRFIKDNDAVIFFDFREDRMRQIVSAFALKNFSKFPVQKFSNLYIATMTNYDESFNVPAAFPPDRVDQPLGKILAEHGKTQFRIAETYKYPHITYFFNGLREEPFQNEYRVMIPSRALLRQDDHPEMMAPEIARRLIESVSERAFDFILASFANPDVIAHTGNFDACLRTVNILDKIVGDVINVSLETGSILLITSDHGNIERVRDPLTGQPETQHDKSPVPIYLVATEVKRRKDALAVKKTETQTVGILADVAPTILDLIGIKKPKEMTGQSLVKLLR